MLILYVAMKDDYGRPEQGRSFEHHNFYEALVRMGHDILYFDFMGLLARHGREAMNRRLLDVARAEKPTAVFTVLFRDELLPATIRRLPDAGSGPTINWFCDDAWRFEEFSRRWARAFTWVVTTAKSALPRYARHGIRNVIKSQWACNHFLYRRLDQPPAWDVTFVGQPHGDRPRIIRALRDAGLDVRVWGQGWESGRLSQEAMIEVFNRSRINLNLANVSSHPAPARGAGATARRLAARLAVRLPGGERLRDAVRAARARRRAAAAAAGPAGGGPPLPQQIKGRNFEVPGCGGFLLTDVAEDLESYYASGREIATFADTTDLVRQARHFLERDGERAAIARAGQERTLREHTYVHRFCDIFRAAGLPTLPPEALLGGQAGPGATIEIT